MTVSPNQIIIIIIIMHMDPLATPSLCHLSLCDISNTLVRYIHISRYHSHIDIWINADAGKKLTLVDDLRRTTLESVFWNVRGKTIRPVDLIDSVEGYGAVEQHANFHGRIRGSGEYVG